MGVFMLNEIELRDKLVNGKITVAVYGLGHIGSPILAAWLLSGARGIGVDIDGRKVELLNKGMSPVKEPCLEEIFKRGREEGKLWATTNGVEASRRSDVKIIAVPTLLKGTEWPKNPDLSAIKSAAKNISLGLKKGDLVIVESSVPPGTTRNLVKPILEESGLKAGKDFGLAYSPERIAEGRALRDIMESYPKIIGGIDKRSTRVASILYSQIAKKGVIEVSNDIVAEFEKLAEGIYRDVNIALANELAGLARVLGIDYDEVMAAANSQPYSHLHRPGTGVGGLCIPIYPHFLSWIAKERGLRLTLTEEARKINESMPRKIVELVVEGIKKLEIGSPKVSVLGLAFRGDVPDPRMSPTYDLLEELRRRGIDIVAVHDPFIEEDPRLDELGIPLTKNLDEALSLPNIALISTDHSIYRLKLSELFGKYRNILLVIDGRHILDVDMIPPGKGYVGIGRPWLLG